MLRTIVIAVAMMLIGAVWGVIGYRAIVPFPVDAAARGEALQDPAKAAWLYQNVSDVFVTRTVARDANAPAMTERSVDFRDFDFEYDGVEKGLEDLFVDMETTGLVVVHDGDIVYERYARGAEQGTRFTTFSVVKSITSALVGAAIQDGAIDSVADPIERYVPEAAGTAYEGVTIEQALQMSSGVGFDLDDSGVGEDTVQLIVDTVVTGKRPALDVALSFPRIAEPGTAFNYNTAESQVILEVVMRATGKSASEYLEETIWAPLGMSHDAGWGIDRPGEAGREMGGAFFNAALRDWARFGQLFAQDGVWDGERILPEGWVRASTTSDAPHLARGTVHSGGSELRGYAYHWWTLPRGKFTASGAYGQTIYVSPEDKLVVARASAWPGGYDLDYDNQSIAAFNALGDFLSERLTLEEVLQQVRPDSAPVSSVEATSTGFPADPAQ